MSEKKDSILSEIKKRRKRKTNSITEGMAATALMDTGGVLSDAARSLGCSTQTLSKIISENNYLKSVQNSAENAVSDIAEKYLINHIKDGNLSAIKWWLARKAKGRGYSTQHEITGKDGADLFGASDEQAEQIIAKFLQVNDGAVIESQGDEDTPEGDTVH